jgi:oligoribonuclease NrnB/cAMP/cGMP phosphodiesterase (DHH superfamily)
MDPNNVNVVIYHGGCSDGMGARYAAQKLLGNRAEYYPSVHGEPPPDVKDKVVVILDYSYDLETTKKLITDAQDLLIIDHHQSALIELSELSKYTRFDMKHSGAILAWNFFHPGKEPPKFLQYIEDRDLWKWELPYSREFSKAFDMVPFEFEEFDKFCDDSVFDDAVKRGSYILAYSRTVLNKMIDMADDRIMKGHHIKVINSCHLMSELGNQLSMEADFALIWYYDPKEMINKVSLRGFHEDVDVSEIAKQYGGGGHPKAAGFSYKGSIEKLFSKKKLEEFREKKKESD